MSSADVRVRGADSAPATMTVAEPLPDIGRIRESSVRAWLVHSWIQCLRLLWGWARSPGTTIQTVVYPSLMLVMFWVVLGDSVTTATGRPSVYGTVPLLTLIAAMAGAVVSALGFKVEKATGLLGRFATMPIHRAAGLTGRLLAEAIRVFITTLCVVAVGFGLGFRFTQGPLAAVAMLGIPVLFGVAFAVCTTVLATLTEGPLLVQVIALVNTLLMFFNSGFVPVDSYPSWLQPIVGNQPMSCAIDAMRGLSYGGAVATPLAKTLAWTIGVVVVCAYPAIRGYRRAAAGG